MEYVGKAMGGAALGVSIPILIEYGAKGQRLMGAVKYSAVAGLAEAGVAGLAAVGSAQGWWLRGMADSDRALLGSVAGAGLATGVSIAILDELRKRALYEFKQKGGYPPREIPLVEGYPRMQERTPTAPLVEEI